MNNYFGIDYPYSEYAIVYPHAGGGSWLGNLIYSLETASYYLSPCKLTFDSEPLSLSIDFRHRFEYLFDTEMALNDLSMYKKTFLFSTNRPFNLFLNENKKLHYNPKCFDNQHLPFADQLELITQRACGLIANNNFKEYYYKNIDLDNEWIFTDPDRFIDKLFDILDSIKIKYNKNRDFCLRSIENYKKTCENPVHHNGNLDSIFWVGWCQALSMNFELPISKTFNFVTAESIHDVAMAIAPINQMCMELTEQYCFYWK